MGKMRQSSLSEDYTEELNLLENIEMRTSTLCDKLRLKQDMHVSWSDLCSILSPSPNKLADKIFQYYNDLEETYDDVYYKILEDISTIGNNDEEFWNVDVLCFQSIASIIYKYFRQYWWIITQTMSEIHNMYPSITDMDFVFTEAVLTLRERRIIKDDLFGSGLDGNKLN